jgi:serine/threonine-protein kinase ATR
LRENKDSLTSVLEAFIHDPLVEWQDQKRREVSLRTIWEAPGMSGN